MRGNRYTVRGARGERGSSLTEFAIVAPLFASMVFASMYLTELGGFKLKTQEIARYGAWAFTQHPLSAYDDDDFRHPEKYDEARDKVADELTDVYFDLDGANDRLLPLPGAWGMTALALYEPPAVGSDFRNEAVQFLPGFAQGEWASPLSTIGLILNFLGFGTGTESFAGGPFRRLHFNHQGQVSAKATVRLVLPVDVQRMRRAVALADVGTVRGADLRRWIPSGRKILDENNKPIQVELVVDSWKIHDGFTAHPRRESGYANMVQEVSDNGIAAFPGGAIISLILGLRQATKNIPPVALEIFGFLPSNPRSHLFSKPYIDDRAEQPTYTGTPAPGQIDLFDYVGRDDLQEDDAVTNFETMPLYLDPEAPGDSGYLESLNERGQNYMGCPTVEKRGCWE
jgi:hypothetical protein